MATVLFVLFDGGGNVNPYLALGAHLHAAGHRSVVACPAPLAPRIRTAGFEVVAESAEWFVDLPTAAEAARTAGADVVVADFMTVDALSAGDVVGVPTVPLVHTLFGDLETDGVPMPMTAFATIEGVNETRAQHGLPALAALRTFFDRAPAVLVTVPPELERRAGDDRFVVTGALYEEPPPGETWTPPPGDDPLVVVGFGTSFTDPGRERALTLRTIEALTDVACRVLVTVAPYLDIGDVTIPDHVTVSGYVRHPLVLPHAELLVCHGGLGSVNAALAHGVRLVAAPIDRDQPGTGTALARAGLGTVIDRDAEVDTIRTAIDETLAGPRPSIAPARPEAAVAAIERVLATPD